MSLIDAIKICDDGENINSNDLMKLPFIDLIMNGNFDINN